MISDLPVFVMTFVTGFLLVFAINLTITDVFRRRQRIQQKQLEEERREQQREEIHRKAELQKTTLLAVAQSDNLEELAKDAFKDDLEESISQKLKRMVDQSGLNITVNGLLTKSAIAGIITGAAVFVLMQSALWAIAMATVVAVIPVAYVELKRRKRLDKLRSQLPDAFDLMGRVLRAGQTTSQAMQAVSQEFDPPLAYEFGYCYEQQNLGITPDVALKDLAKRTGLLEIKIFVLSLLIHRQVGGNMADLLEKLANIVRERFRLRSKVGALTAEGRFQAIILIGLPIAVWVALLFVNREYALKLLDHPNLVLATLASMSIGAFWIRKIVNFEF
jgi:tight adherence protein B